MKLDRRTEKIQVAKNKQLLMHLTQNYMTPYIDIPKVEGSRRKVFDLKMENFDR